MKTKEQKVKKRMVKVSEEALLSLVASQINGRDLFPEKVAEARRLLSTVASDPFTN